MKSYGTRQKEAKEKEEKRTKKERKKKRKKRTKINSALSKRLRGPNQPTAPKQKGARADNRPAGEPKTTADRGKEGFKQKVKRANRRLWNYVCNGSTRKEIKIAA